MAKYLKYVISGSYYNSKKEIVDFDAVTGVIPMCDEENGVGSMHVRGRFAPKWIKEAKNDKGEAKYPERIHKMRQTHIDDIQVVDVKGDYSFVGKDLKQLSLDEMQDLAVAKDLRLIPLPLGSGYDLRDMRVRAYAAYAEKVLDKDIGYQKEGFNFAKLPSITLDGEMRVETEEKVSNDEVLDAEAKNTSTEGVKSSLSLKDLKDLADERKIPYHKTIGYDALYQKLFALSA